MITISGNVFPTGISTFIRILYTTNPITQMIMFGICTAWLLLSCFNKKKSAIWIAIIGANTEPIRYRKSVILSIGYTIAAAVPITVTTIATCFPFHLLTTVSLEIPAEYASRKVVVTVENTMIRSPRMPRPAFNFLSESKNHPSTLSYHFYTLNKYVFPSPAYLRTLPKLLHYISPLQTAV